ncbi:hypothetical protein BDZ88DRAFT_319783 [Geranomyces variabilis]|nr:hypothetical protein BDZ88DRAFT_319783 [Geranomyces variabilis]
MKELLDMGPAQRQFWKRWSTVGPLLADLDLISGLREALEKAKATVALKKFRGKTWYFVASAELPGTSGQNADEKLRASIRSQDTNRVLEHRMRPEKGDRSQTRGYLLASDFFGDLANISEETTKALLDPQWAKARAIVSGEDVDSDDEAAAQRWVATVEARLAAGEGSSGPVSKKARIEKRTAEEEALAPFGTPAEILDEPKDMLAPPITAGSAVASSLASRRRTAELPLPRRCRKILMVSGTWVVLRQSAEPPITAGSPVP